MNYNGIDGAQSPEMLLKLAPELIHLISEDLLVQDIKSLRLTCTHLARVLAHLIFRNVTINISRTNVHNSLSKLVAFAQPYHLAHQATKYLAISSLLPISDPNTEPINITTEEYCQQNRDGVEPEGIKRVLDIIKAELPKAVSALKGVREVHWGPQKKDGEELLAAVFDALEKLPNVQKMTITPWHCNLLPSFQSLDDLRALSFQGTRGTCDDDGLAMFENIARTITVLGPRHPGRLTSLEVSHHWNYREVDKNQSFDDLFKHYPRNTAPLRLRQLTLSGCIVTFDASTLPHLKHLTSLELGRIDSPSRKFRPLNRCSDPVGIWTALQSIQVRLKVIKVDFVTYSMITYLSSYTGLETLHITPFNLSDKQASDTMGYIFYGKALTSHADTLQDLEIRAPFEGSWCFGDHNVSIVSRLTKLQNLRVGVISSQLWTEQDFQEQDAVKINKDPVHLLLDSLITSQQDLLRLKTLCIAPAKTESLRFARCGNGALAHHSRVCKKLGQSVRRYTAPLSCNNLPTLVIGELHHPTLLFKIVRTAGRSDPGDGLLKYEGISPRSNLNPPYNVRRVNRR